MPETKCLTVMVQSLHALRHTIICESWTLLRINFSVRKMFRHLVHTFKGFPESLKFIPGLQVYNSLGQPTTRPHCIELTDSLHVGKEGKEEPEQWPRESAYNLPRLVEAGVCPGRKAGRSTLPQEEEEGNMEEEAQNDNQSQERVGWPPAKAVPPRSPEHLTQGEGHRGRSACQGSLGKGPLGTSGSNRGFTPPGLSRGAGRCWDSPAMCMQTRWALAWEGQGGPGRTPFQGRSQIRIGSQKAWGGQGEATSQQPMGKGLPGYSGRINSTHVGQGRGDYFLLPSNRVGGFLSEI